MREFCVIVLGISLAGCTSHPSADYVPQSGAAARTGTSHVEYSFGVLPLNNAVRLFETYEPLIDEINQRAVGFTVRLETAKDYPHYEAKVRDRRLAFLIMNSHLVIRSEERGYRIVGRTADMIRGCVVLRRDAAVRNVRDLRGASISFPSSTDLPGAMMPKLLLKQSGLDADRQAVPKYVGSPDSALMNVYFKRSAAGCVSDSAWLSFQARRPEIAEMLEVRWETAPLVGLGVLARKDIPREHVQEVARALFDLDQSDSGRKILAGLSMSSFIPAGEASYDGVWEFLNDYRRAFGYTPTLRGPG